MSVVVLPSCSTRAAIHADGLNKDEEIYNIFDTDALLNRPVAVAIAETSGPPVIAHWINDHYRLGPERRVEKSHPGIAKIAAAISQEYEAGRTTNISNQEMDRLVKEHLPELGDCELTGL